MQINFLVEYYKSRALDQNQSRLLNLFLEIENQHIQDAYNTGGVYKQHGKYKITAYPTPGLLAFNTDTGSVVRGMFEKNNILYAVVDNKFNSYSSNGTKTNIGTLNTSTGMVEIVDITDQIMINDRTNCYLYVVSTGTFSTISDVDFPTTPQSISSQDEFFLVSQTNTNTIYGSDVANGASWNALSFASKTGQSDYVIKLVCDERRIFVLGDKTSEVWGNTGAPTFSFEPDTSVFFHYGCAARDSAVVCKGVLYFLSKSKDGGIEVLAIEGYQPKVISTFAITYQLNQLTTYSDAQAFCYTQNGHTFYELTFPTDGKTFLYDCTTTLWSELQSNGTRHQANCYAYCFGFQLVGDYQSGNLYYLDDATYQDNGVAIQREIITPPAYAEGKKIIVKKLQIDFQNNVGSNEAFTVDVSRDSGQTYSYTLTGNVPASGGRVFWTSLGMTQNSWVLRYRTTANAPIILLGATAEADIGIN
jgi:hypothetical protein